MAGDWRSYLRSNPKLKELDRRIRARERELENDKEFVRHTAMLRASFAVPLAKYPGLLHHFFRKFYSPVCPHLRELYDFLSSVKDRKLRILLRRYLRYVARFGAVFRLNRKRSAFSIDYLIPWGTTFHVRLFRSHFEPATGYDRSADSFESSDLKDLKMPLPLQKQIEVGKAKFVRIDDKSWSSVLTELEGFAYDASSLTFILHRAEQPYLLCLVGERVTNEQWTKASKTVSAFLRENFNRGKAGRPKNLVRYRQGIKIRRRPGMLKEKLPVEPDVEKKFHSEQAYSARVGKSLRD